MSDIWQKEGMLNNGIKHPEFSRGFLFVKGKNGINTVPFRYEDKGQQYNEVISPIGSEYTVPRRTIYTSLYWLPFSSTARVRLSDGVEMTIRDFTPDINTKSITSWNPQGIIGLTLILEGS